MKKYKVTDKQIEKIAESAMDRIKKEDLDNLIGDPEDRRIEYPEPADIEKVKIGDTNLDTDDADVIDPKDMSTPPQELLNYLEKIEEAKSILSKVAAKESNENIKNRIYAHYEKAQKLAFELIKEFGIVH